MSTSTPKVATDFATFAKAINEHYTEMSKGELFVVNLDKDDIYTAYLKAFPQGTNPMFRERTEHDCNTCKQFIRTLGRVVSIKDNKLVSVWSAPNLGYPYDEVAAELNDLVTSRQISRVFRTIERQYGAELTYESKPGQPVRTWHHLYGRVAAQHHSLTAGQVIGQFADIYQVFRRGVQEITTEALATVMDLITSNSLYRGEEHKTAVASFMSLHQAYNGIRSASARDCYLWSRINERNARFRNTVIGTLVTDLSEGVAIDVAVRSFESKVAPANYKRPTAIVTQSMVDNALKTIEECGAEPALYRRHATLRDISVNNVLFADVAAQSQMKDGIAGLLSSVVRPAVADFSKAQEILADDFVDKVLPTVTAMELYIDNDMQGNFMSLTAPQVPDAMNIFKWDNNFAWSYDGNVADSVKERVKAAGGNVSAKYRVSLAWYNHDDLDIHARTPDGKHIYFGDKKGVLDVDMNAGGRMSTSPVENLSWNALKNGEYTISVHNYNKRDSTDVGFEIDAEFEGQPVKLKYTLGLSQGQEVTAMTFTKTSKGVVYKPGPHMQLGSSPVEKWGVKTNTPVKVSTLLWSPNHWDGNEVGNRHLFFILDGCRNPELVRGMYNEFLNSRFEPHRKVFEVLADKMKCAYSDDQMSGVGFSTTQTRQVKLVVYSGKRPTAYRVVF